MIQIEIIRYNSKCGALNGTLYIGDQRVCDTCENDHYHLCTGTYHVSITHCQQYHRKMPVISIRDEPMTARCHHCRKHPIDSQHANLPYYCPLIKIGNGVAHRTDGSIIIGDQLLMGVVVNSADHFNRLIDRLDKAAQRGEEITLTIKNRDYTKFTLNE